MKIDIKNLLCIVTWLVGASLYSFGGSTLHATYSISIISGPSVRTPGDPTPTVIRVDGATGTLFWKNQNGLDVGTGVTLSVTEPGTYSAWDVKPCNPLPKDDPSCETAKNAGSITIGGTTNAPSPHIVIASGPAVRIPGITAPTVLEANGAQGTVRWEYADRTVVSEGPTVSITQSGFYYAADVRPCNPPVPGEPDCETAQDLGAIDLRLKNHIEVTGANPLDASSAGTILTVVSNAAGYMTNVVWFRNGHIEPGAGTAAWRPVTVPGNYSAQVTYTFNGESGTVTLPIVLISRFADAPQVEFMPNSDFNATFTTYNPVAPPVLTVSNYNKSTEFTLYRDDQPQLTRTNVPAKPAEFVIDRPGVYVVGGLTTATSHYAYSEEMAIPKGGLPVPPIHASSILSDEHPTVTLSAPAGYQSYAWFSHGAAIPGANTKAVTVTRTGIYTVKGCATYPDGDFQCETSQPFELTGEIQYVNVIRKQVPLVDNIASTTQLDALPRSQVNTTQSYLDGFARPVEEIQQAFSPLGNDVAVIHNYDFMGREQKKFLPFAPAGHTDGAFMRLIPARSKLDAFYGLAGDHVADTGFPFADVLFETSPLSRPVAQGAPGEDWALANSGHNKAMAYTHNRTADNVLSWSASGQTPLATTYYTPGTLSVMQTADENGHLSREFKDKTGHVVMTEKAIENGAVLRTYFVFDDLQRLTFVIPPKTAGALPNTLPVTVSAETLAKECYSYVYDDRSRVVTKNIPGAGPSYMVYDPWDRVVLTQHANQRTQNKWSFSKYDALSRVVMTGEIGLQASLQAAQQAVSTFYAGTGTNPALRYESAGNAIHGYTNRSYPVLTQETQAYLVNYYDNYNFLNAFGTTFQFTPEATLGLTASSTRVTGLITGIKTIILGTTSYLKTASYYDAKHRLIQVIMDNQFGGIDLTSTQLDFTGRLLQTKKIHNGSQQVTVLEEHSYDPAGRKLQVHHTINNGPRTLLCDYRYNELGQLIEKNLHSTDGGNTFLQSQDYTYNIRGWLLSVNHGETDDNATYPDQYGFSLSYATSEDNQPSFEPSFNGNIAAFGQTRPGDGGLSKSVYNYRYDARDQLKAAQYFQPSAAAQDGVYDMPVITYDPNGNIQTLQRKGITTSGTPGMIDNLNYFYNGNQLIRVDDSADASKGFIKK